MPGIDTERVCDQRRLNNDMSQLICVYCTDLVLPHNAKQLPCRHVFCGDCVMGDLRAREERNLDGQCPHDRLQFAPQQLTPLLDANEFMYRMLSRTEVRCARYQDIVPCAWVGEVADLAIHEENCAAGAHCNCCVEGRQEIERMTEALAAGNALVETLQEDMRLQMESRHQENIIRDQRVRTLEENLSILTRKLEDANEAHDAAQQESRQTAYELAEAMCTLNDTLQNATEAHQKARDLEAENSRLRKDLDKVLEAKAAAQQAAQQKEMESDEEISNLRCALDVLRAAHQEELALLKAQLQMHTLEMQERRESYDRMMGEGLKLSTQLVELYRSGSGKMPEALSPAKSAKVWEDAAQSPDPEFKPSVCSRGHSSSLSNSWLRENPSISQRSGVSSAQSSPSYLRSGQGSRQSDQSSVSSTFRRIILNGNQSSVRALALGNWGSIWSAGSDGTLRNWTAEDGAFKQELIMPPAKGKSDCRGELQALAYGPGDKLWAGDTRGKIHLWVGGRYEKVLAGHRKSVVAMVVSPEGILWSGSLDGRIKRWVNGDCVKTLSLPRSGGVTCLILSDNNVLMSGYDEGSIRWWENDNVVTHVPSAHRSTVRTLAKGTDGIFWSAGDDLIIKGWKDRSCLVSWDGQGSGHLDHILALAVSDDSTVWSGSKDKTVKGWRNGRCVAILEGHEKSVNALAVSPDGNLWSGSDDNHIRSWNILEHILY